ncbi:MAG: hypothetical protein R3F55_21105 [Alphaproteobacteria bacterium]
MAFLRARGERKQQRRALLTIEADLEADTNLHRKDLLWAQATIGSVAIKNVAADDWFPRRHAARGGAGICPPAEAAPSSQTVDRLRGIADRRIVRCDIVVNATISHRCDGEWETHDDF